jgi:hypothetical protein
MQIELFEGPGRPFRCAVDGEHGALRGLEAAARLESEAFHACAHGAMGRRSRRR